MAIKGNKVLKYLKMLSETYRQKKNMLYDSFKLIKCLE